MKHPLTDKLLLVGRCEWCALPDIAIPAIKAKIDTGAKTSAIHAFDIHSEDQRHVFFKVHPLQANTEIIVECCAPIVDQRYIMSSNGHKEHRYIIMTKLRLGAAVTDIELSLSNRDPLTFRLLLGREALSQRMLIDPSLTCVQGRHKRKVAEALYAG